MRIPYSTYGIGWKSRSGKKRLNSIKIPAVIVNHRVAATGAVEINLIKYDDESPLSAMNLASKTSERVQMISVGKRVFLYP